MAEAAEASSVGLENQPLDPITLSEDDLSTLLEVLCNAAHKWERIATFLKLGSGGAIEVIKHKPIDPEDKLLEVIKRWLKMVTPAPTVEALVQALKQPFVDEEKTALRIMKKFYPNRSHACLQKSMSSTEAQTEAVHTQQALGRSESSPAAVTVSSCSATVVQDTSTQVNISECDLPAKPNSQQNRDDVLDASVTDVERTSSYKYLDVKKMTELEQRTLKGRLTNDYKRITSCYAKLNEYVIQSLKDHAVTPKQLSRVLMNLSAFRVQRHDAMPLLADNLDKIRDAEEVDDVFYTLRSYGSFFDCHVVKHIATSNLCTDDDRKELEKYEKELEWYCQRSVFECPHIASLDPKFQSFVMKVDDVVLKSSEMKAIDAFRVKLAEACGLEGHTLRLCSVDEGCLQLTFQIAPSVVNAIFPLTAEQELALKGLGVLKLTCGHTWVYNFDHSQFQQPKNTGCAWRKLMGRCNYGDECRHDHDIDPVRNPEVENLPESASLETVKRIAPSGYTPDGKAYVIVWGEDMMKIIAEDKPTMEFAQAEVQKKLLSLPNLQYTRLKYSYFHPVGIEQPVLYVFKEKEHEENCFQLEQIKPKEPVTEMATVESFGHFPRKHVSDAYSRLSRYKRNVYPIQLRRDYREDILEQLRQGLTWMHENDLTPQIEGRFGKMTWRACIRDECFDIHKLIGFTNEGSGVSNFIFNTIVESDDAIALKKGLKQVGPKEHTYTLILKHRHGVGESYRVKIKFDAHGKPVILYTRKLVSGDPKMRILFDILFLHRKYDIRVSLSSVERVDNSTVEHFISSSIAMPEPGVLHYDPTASPEKWFVSFIRHQESEIFELKDLFTVEIAAVGQLRYEHPSDTKQIISPKDLCKRHEIELHCDLLATSPSTPTTAWTPDSVMTDFENIGFLQTMEDLNKEINESP